MRKHQPVVRSLFFVCLALAGLASVTYAQVLTGTLTGSVVDPTDAVIPDATITVVDLSTNQDYHATSDAAGNFTIPNLPNGFFKVTVEAKGFTKVVIERVQIYVSQVARVVARMELARTGTEIVVVAEQSVVQTESSELKSSVDRAQIIDLPLPTRNPMDLVRTMPGIVAPNNGSVTAGDSFVHGLRGNSTNLTQDGINVADNFVKTSAFFAISAPTVDSVGEFNVSVGGIGADAGFGAAQVSIRTQRGSNDFHGSALWFQRTSFLNANTWFNNVNGLPTPFQLQNRIGINGGAPVYLPKIYNGRNRTWVFGSYEAYREPRSQPRVRTVLTPSARQGLFTYVPTSGGAPRQVNLFSLGTIGTSSAAPAINKNVMDFYNSIVPAEGLTDQGCSGDGVNIRCLPLNLPGKSIQDRYTIRADHQLTDKHAIEFVFNQADFDSTPDFLNGIEPNFPKAIGGGQRSRRQVFTWAFQSVFASNKTNEARFGYTRAPVAFALDEKYQATGGYQLNLGGTVTDPTITTTNLPQGRNTPVRQVADNFAWVKGSHSLRFGGEYRQILANSYFYNTVVPRVVLGTNSANPNGLSTANLPGISSGDLTRAQGVFNIVTGLLGNIGQGFNHTSPTSGFVKGVPRTIDPIQHNVSFYAQDSFKVRPNLTLSFGTRWEFQGVFDLRNGLILLPEPGTVGLWGPAGFGNLFNPVSTPAMTDVLLNFAGGHNGKPIWKRDWNNFAPFAGFAWDPFRTGKTSIRGSFATHYTQDGFTLPQLSATGNNGLFSVLNNSTPTGVFSSSSNPTPAAPVAKFPVSQRENSIANNGQALWNFDNNLRTPYVLEWNIGIQREIWNKVAIEARYVGNHAVKQFRSWSLNEMDFVNNGLINEFVNAQKNLAIGRTSFANQGMPGQVPLPIFDKLFAGLASASGYTNSGFLTQLNQNQIGGLFDTIRRSNTYRVNREANFPLNFFVANPFANGALQVDNAGWSYYHGLEVEVTRRFSRSGFFFQANYTYSKVLTDVRFGASQNEGQNYLSLKNRGLDKARAAIDVPQSFSMNFLYPLPFGRGRRFGSSAGPFADRLISGWGFQGFTKWSTGAPVSITSPRLTTGSLETMTAVVRNMTASDLKKQIGVFRRPEGVFYINPDSGLFTISGASSRAVICGAGQTTPCLDYSGANQFGNLPYLGLTLGRFFDQSFSVMKKTPIKERMNFEIRLEMFGAFNNPNFGGAQNNVDSSTFGRLTSTVDSARGGGVTSRIIQWAAKFNW